MRVDKHFAYARKWTDKSAPKHKHDFSVAAVCRLDAKGGYCKQSMGGRTSFYKVEKCNKCNSFINAVYIEDQDVDESLPVVHLKNASYPSKFKGAVQV